jgi:hypothetical protein
MNMARQETASDSPQADIRSALDDYWDYSQHVNDGIDDQGWLVCTLQGVIESVRQAIDDGTFQGEGADDIRWACDTAEECLEEATAAVETARQAAVGCRTWKTSAGPAQPRCSAGCAALASGSRGKEARHDETQTA